MSRFQKEDLAWQAGLFDGEGSFFKVGRRGGCASLSMTDKPSVVRYQSILGIGKVTKRDNSPFKPVYECRVCSFEHVQYVASILWAWLGEAKKKDAIKVLKNMAKGRPSPGLGVHHTRKKCANGHPFTEKTTYVDKKGVRVCKVCRNESVKRWMKNKENK